MTRKLVDSEAENVAGCLNNRRLIFKAWPHAGLKENILRKGRARCPVLSAHSSCYRLDVPVYEHGGRFGGCFIAGYVSRWKARPFRAGWSGVEKGAE